MEGSSSSKRQLQLWRSWRTVIVGPRKRRGWEAGGGSDPETGNPEHPEAGRLWVGLGREERSGAAKCGAAPPRAARKVWTSVSSAHTDTVPRVPRRVTSLIVQHPDPPPALPSFLPSSASSVRGWGFLLSRSENCGFQSFTDQECLPAKLPLKVPTEFQENIPRTANLGLPESTSSQGTQVGRSPPPFQGPSFTSFTRHSRPLRKSLCPSAFSQQNQIVTTRMLLFKVESCCESFPGQRFFCKVISCALLFFFFT